MVVREQRSDRKKFQPGGDNCTTPALNALINEVNDGVVDCDGMFGGLMRWFT